MRVTAHIPSNLTESERIEAIEATNKALNFKNVHNKMMGEQTIWTDDPNPTVAALEKEYYNYLALPLWYSMEALFQVLGFDLPDQGLEKSLEKERLAYKVDCSNLNNETVIYLPINRLEYPYQTKKALDDDKIRSMEADIKKLKELEPVVIGYNYDVHDGNHRIEASKNLKLSHVPCVVRGLKINKVKQAEKAYQELYKAFNFFMGEEIKIAADFLKKSVWREEDHPRDERGRFTTKWGRAVGIGRDLKKIRSTYREDLRQEGLGRDKVTALLVGLIDKGCFRIGNDVSRERDGVMGITTLTPENVRVEGSKMIFEYTGKRGVPQKRVLQDKLMAGVMEEMLAIDEKPKKPGGKEEIDAIFKYYNTKGELRSVSNYVVNQYLDRWGITAKDFRTYHATRIVFEELNKQPQPRKLEDRKEKIDEAISKAAEKLGHEPRTAKRSYVDPNLINLYMHSRFRKSMDTKEYTWADYADLFGVWEDDDKLEKSSKFKAFVERMRSKVRRRMRDRLRYKPDGGHYTRKQLEDMEKLLRQFNVNYHDYVRELKIKGAVAGRVIDHLLEGEKVDPDDIPVDMATVRKRFNLRGDKGSEVPVLPLNKQEKNAIEWAEQYVGENIRSKQEDFISGVKQIVMEGRKNRKSASEVTQELFDHYGELNRDWRRIAVTELGESLNNGYLHTLDEGDYVVGQSAAGACTKCLELVSGKVYRVVKEPGDWDTEIWPGKSNVNRKRRNWVSAVIMHPHCRCRWTKINTKFYKVEDGKVKLKSKEEVVRGE